MTLAEQRDFLLRLAPVYLQCRAEVFGSTARPLSMDELSFQMLGMTDYAAEMAMLCAEVRARRRAVIFTRPIAGGC